MSDCLWHQGLYNSWNSSGQNTGVGRLSLLQGIFPNQGLNLGLLHCKLILYQLSHQGSPRIQEWVAYPFSWATSQPRNWIKVSCIAGGFFTSWATREAILFLTFPQSYLALWWFLNMLFMRRLCLQWRSVWKVLVCYLHLYVTQNNSDFLMCKMMTVTSSCRN